MMAPLPDEPPPTGIDGVRSPRRSSRRDLLAIGALGALTPSAAWASGGATAGKYTTIPIAKRRYYGRVKQGVFEFLIAGDAVRKGNLGDEDITEFFADTIKVQSKRQRRQCIGGGDECVVKEKFSSRWEDMKLSMYLLGNAYRKDSGQAPDKVKQVKEAKAFFNQVEKLRGAAQSGNNKVAALSYANAVEALEAYLNDVDLPPTSNPEYSADIDVSVPSLCQGSFCI